MLTRDFGSTGVKVPVIGQGTWQIGKNGLEALRAGIDLGMTHIDTAEMYTGSEEVIADAIRGIRKKIFLVSKVVPSNASYKGTLRACDTSLKRLATDYLDVYGKTPRQVALNFLTRRKSLFAIPKASKVDHVRENGGGTGWELTEDDLNLIEAAFPPPGKNEPLEVI